MSVKVKDYSKMTIKQLEKEHLKESQELLNMFNNEWYFKTKQGQKCFKMKKEIVDYIYKVLSVKLNYVNNILK